MKYPKPQTFLASLIIGVAGIVGTYIIIHHFTGRGHSELNEFAKAGIASLIMALLVGAYWKTRTSERKLRHANQELQALSAERAEVLEQLRESQTSLTNAQRIARLGSWDWNIQTGDLIWSDEIYRIFGLAPQEFGATYEAFVKFIHPDDRQTVTDAINAAVYDKKPYAIEHRVVWPDGTVRFVQEQGEVRYDDAGTPVLMSGTVHDITERKLREDEIKNLNVQLEQRVTERTAELSDEIAVRKDAERRSQHEREKAERYLAMAGNMLVALDTQGRIDMLNAKGAEILGYDSAEELLGRDWFDAALPVEERHVVRNVFHEIVSGNQDAFEEFENEVLTKSGDKRLMQWHNAVIRDETGAIVSILGAATDITEQKHHEENLLRAKEAAEEASRTKSGFLSNMSHELRTPMNAILGFGQLVLADRQNLTDAQVEYINIILKSGNHLLTLINEILDLSRIEVGALKVELQDLSPAHAIEEATALLSPIADKHGVTMHVDENVGRLPHISADAARLQQILVNLISNAIKYNRESGQVFIGSTKTDNQMLRIFVQDTGHGIPPEYRHELFQAFNRLDAENSGIEGTGVGLVLTKNLVEMMDGHIGFDSTVGHGSTFWIDLPVAPSHERRSAARKPRLHERDGKRVHRILSIESNLTDQRVLKEMVDQLTDVELIPAPDVDRALSLAKLHQPDLVMVNVDLPCDSETEMQIWCLEQDDPIPVVAVCECQGIRDVENCHLQSYTACIDKPLRMEKALDTLRDILQLDPADDPNVVALSSARPKT